MKDDCPPEQGNKPWHDGVRNPSWSPEQTLSQAQRREVTFNQSKAIHIAAVTRKPRNSDSGHVYFGSLGLFYIICSFVGSMQIVGTFHLIIALRLASLNSMQTSTRIAFSDYIYWQGGFIYLSDTEVI